MSDELKEKIAEIVYGNFCPTEMVGGAEIVTCVNKYVDCDDCKANQILTLIKESGYVKLDKDQSLPSNPVADWVDINPRKAWGNAQKDMFKAKFRRVIL
jgi:hypothetical protein